MAYCAICGRDHAPGPCGGVDLGLPGDDKKQAPLDPDLRRSIKRMDSLLFAGAVGVLILIPPR